MLLFTPMLCFMYFNLKLVTKDILAKTAPVYVHLTVNLTAVNTRMDGALSVLQVGWVILVEQVNFCRLSNGLDIRFVR